MEFQMKSAHFVLPCVQQSIEYMTNAAERTLESAKRDLKYATSAKTRKLLTTFGAMAVNYGAELSAWIGMRPVASRYENGEYIKGYLVPRMNVTIRFDELDSFKHDKLMELLEVLDGMGLKVETQDYTHSESPNREFAFETDDYRLRIDAWVKSDSPFCRRVKTGETVETVVKETWDIQCD
jgi:hypothetical protein